MNKQEALFFEALSKDRSEIADVLERRAVRGYKDSVVEKYSDQAHFIYELLQNADDACATNARFILEENRLIFAHNGTRHFFVSNPANEDIDSERKTLGDINAITSIEELRDTAIDLPVRGAINGWCYLVPYEGKLKSHTVKKVIGMFIPQNRNGQEKMVSVSVVKEDRIIYISKDMFKIYEQSLSEPDGIQLKRTFF